MNSKKFLIITIIYLIVIFSLNYIVYTIPLAYSPDGIAEWTGTAEKMESQVVGPSFVVDYLGGELWKIIWITIIITPGIIIAYKFYKQIIIKN